MADLKPKATVRRFDVFAEYNRLKAMKEGESAAQAKGYGLWVAKVVAAQKFGRMPKPTGEKGEGGGEKKPRKKWHDLSGVPQTDKLFDKEIINRMGKDFYSKVFSPAIKEAFEEGKQYVEIRDSIRREWKP
ncbi:MAG TPA: hypothetical protein VFD70_04220 [Anaerolineae bacterium]|nr:hypothetical protein [Anaerolineae bacterium]